MKKIKCYDCEEIFEGETSESILNQMYPHYMSKHTDVITGASEQEKNDWMDKFKKDWEGAEQL